MIWDSRLRRAEVLQREWPFAQEVLRFYHVVTSFQNNLHGSLEAVKPAGLEMSLLLDLFPPFLALIENMGPSVLAREAGVLKGESRARWEDLLRGVWERASGETETLQFFPRAMLQPYATWLHRNWEGSPGEPTGLCPRCGRAPVVSVLREDVEAAAVVRTLLCSFCSGEWGFPRIVCPGCGEERPEKLPRISADEIPWMRVEACDTCHTYLKGVDLSKQVGADAVTDEVASTPLDVAARGEGYAKLEVNLVGM